MKYLFLIPAFLTAVIIGLSIYLQPNDYIGCGEVPAAGTGQCSPVDAIVVVSGGNTQNRTAEGIKLYQSGWADAVIFSGAAQDKSGPSNAEAMKLQALRAGVPERVIYTEERSENTEQNATNTDEIFSDNNFQEVMLVTSGYHQRRASLEFEKRTGDVAILNRPLLNDGDWNGWWWVTPRGWWLSVGEVVKIGIFYAQGAVE
jgi:uncharacterized SAM-binding protein YcdF (DUF218 family)